MSLTNLAIIRALRRACGAYPIDPLGTSVSEIFEQTHPNVGHSCKAAFVSTPEGLMQDIEMFKCENCEMWNMRGVVCVCKQLPISSLSEDKEPVFDAILEQESELMVPCPCLRVLPGDAAYRKTKNFYCSICKGTLLVPKGR